MWRRFLIAFVVLLLALAMAAPAFAQSEDEPKLFDFEGDTVEAEYLKPNTGVVESILRDERKSLIKIRMDFVDEIVRSAEEL